MMSTEPFALQLAHQYNLKKLWESKTMHVSGSFMTLWNLHVTIITVQASTQGRGGEEREGLWWWEGEVHVHWRQVCFAEIILGLITVLTLGSWSTTAARVSKGGQHYPVGTCKIISFHWFPPILIHWIVIYPLSSTT